MRADLTEQSIDPRQEIKDRLVESGYQVCEGRDKNGLRVLRSCDSSLLAIIWFNDPSKNLFWDKRWLVRYKGQQPEIHRVVTDVAEDYSKAGKLVLPVNVYAEYA